MTAGAPVPEPPAAVTAAGWWALEHSADGVAVFDADWTIVYINPAGAAVLDRGVADLLGRNMWSVFPEAVGTPFHRNLLRAAADPDGAEPVRWSAHYGPVHGWFSDRAQRVGDHTVVTYTRADEPREAEATRQRLTSQVQAALARSELLLAASSAFGSAGDVEDVVLILQRLADTGLSPSSVGLYLLDAEDARFLRRQRPQDIASGPLRARYERVALDGEVPVAVTASTGTAQFHEDLAVLGVRFPQAAEDLRTLGMGAAAMIPVPDPDGSATPLGVLALLWDRPRALDVGDRAVVTALATHLGQAVARIRRTERTVRAAESRYADTRAAVLLMQRSLLPDLPVLPHVDVVARYQPADAELAAGGDWYDSVPLPDGRLALLVGDVVGHGPAAAAAMAQLRAVGDHLLRTVPDVRSALAQLDAVAARTPTTRATTLLLAVLDPAGELSWASHGHPPPLVVDAAGKPRTLELRPAAPLGVGGPAAGWRSTELRPGDLLLLFTDGLLERPGRELPDALADLCAAAAELHADGVVSLRSFCADLADRMTDGADDVTVLAARFHDPTPPLELRLAGVPTELREVRRALARWVDPIGLDDDDRTALELVLGEAVTNAVEHAYGGAPGPVDVDVRIDALGGCVLTVRDHGVWRPAPDDPGQRGRGLQLMWSLADHVDVTRGEQGTEVRARRLLGRPPVVTTDPARPPRDRDPDDEYGSALTRGDHPVLRLRGAVDMTVEQRLRTDLLGAGRGGALPLVVDLDEVSLLGSAGVRVLHELAGALRLRLRAAPGTPARAVLDLAALSDRVEDPTRS